MNKSTLGLFIALCLTGSAYGQANIENHETGSGIPQAKVSGTFDLADPWDPERSIYHAPQYMAGYPTSATLFPRVVDVECAKFENGVYKGCKGYNWMPEMGRGEYLFVRPHLVAPPPPPPAPVVVEKIVEKKVFVEVKPPKE